MEILKSPDTVPSAVTCETELDHEYLRITDAIFRLELEYGHLEWKVTKLAQLTNFPRTLLYYRFGNTKLQIFNNALDIVAKEFYGLSAERLRMISSGRGIDCIRLSRQLFKLYPHFSILYFSIRLVNEPPEWLVDIEKQYREKLKRIFPAFSPAELQSFHALLQGIILSPILTDETFDCALTHVLKFSPRQTFEN